MPQQVAATLPKRVTAALCCIEFAAGAGWSARVASGGVFASSTKAGPFGFAVKRIVQMRLFEAPGGAFVERLNFNRAIDCLQTWSSC